MRKTGTKPKSVGKGMSSAVLLSIVIHAALFLLASRFLQRDWEEQP